MSEKQRAFVRVYIETGDAEQAYREAGYAGQGAAKARELLNNPAVQRMIAERKQQQAEDGETAEETGTRPNEVLVGSETEDGGYLGKVNFAASEREGPLGGKVNFAAGETEAGETAEEAGTRPNEILMGSETGTRPNEVLVGSETEDGGYPGKGDIAEQDEILAYLTGVLRGTVEDRDKNAAPAIRDRNRAAELLGKRYALFTEGVSVQTGQPTHIVDDIPEQLGTLSHPTNLRFAAAASDRTAGFCPEAATSDRAAGFCPEAAASDRAAGFCAEAATTDRAAGDAE